LLGRATTNREISEYMKPPKDLLWGVIFTAYAFTNLLPIGQWPFFAIVAGRHNQVKDINLSIFVQVSRAVFGGHATG